MCCARWTHYLGYCQNIPLSIVFQYHNLDSFRDNFIQTRVYSSQYIYIYRVLRIRLLKSQKILQYHKISYKDCILIYTNEYYISSKNIYLIPQLAFLKSFFTTSLMRGCHEHHPFFGHDGIDAGKISHTVSEIQASCKGAGTDEKRLIAATAACNAMERDMVCEAFNQANGKPLFSLLKAELGGNLEKLFCSLYTTRYVFWAEQIHDTISGAGTNEEKLIDLLVSCADNEYREVDRAYTQLYKKSVYEALSAESGSSHWGKMMKAWIKNENVHQGSPQHLAEALFAAAKGAGTDEEVFIQILTSVNHETYRAVDEEFARLYQKSLRSVIKSELNGKSEYAFLAVHDYLIDPVRFVANMLHLSMKGSGTNEDKLIYTTVLHSDWCGGFIGQAYETMGFGNLKKDIKTDLTGKYETAILELWHL
uniref:Annexin 13 n=1 Tax=Spironucleus vortens TaxID=58336 RepID=A0A142C681_SPIVO|nr:annexin 13 [Spironucleus vortens]